MYMTRKERFTYDIVCTCIHCVFSVQYMVYYTQKRKISSSSGSRKSVNGFFTNSAAQTFFLNMDALLL